MKKIIQICLFCFLVESCSDNKKSVDTEKRIVEGSGRTLKDAKLSASKGGVEPDQGRQVDEETADVSPIKSEAAKFEDALNDKALFAKIFKERWSLLDDQLNSIQSPPVIEVGAIEEMFGEAEEELESLIKYLQSNDDSDEVVSLLQRKVYVSAIAASRRPELLLEEMKRNQSDEKFSAKINALVLIILSGNFAKSHKIDLADIGEIAKPGDEFSQYLSLSIMPNFGTRGNQSAESNPQGYKRDLQSARESYFKNFPEPASPQITSLLNEMKGSMDIK